MGLVTSARAGDLYHAMGQGIVEVLPEDFVLAWAKAENGYDFWGIELFYQVPDGSIRYTNEDLDSIMEGFRELLKESSPDRWTSATFRLTNQGSMSIDFGYEDVSDFEQDESYRTAWIAKYLGPSPRIIWA